MAPTFSNINEKLLYESAEALRGLYAAVQTQNSLLQRLVDTQTQILEAIKLSVPKPISVIPPPPATKRYK